MYITYITNIPQQHMDFLEIKLLSSTFRNYTVYFTQNINLIRGPLKKDICPPKFFYKNQFNL